MNIIKKITLLGLLLGITIPQATNAFSFGDQPSIRVISQYVMAAINTAKSYLTFNTIKEHPEVNRSVIGFGLPLACATIATKIENPQVRNAAIGIGLATSAYGVGYGYAALTLRSAHNKFDRFMSIRTEQTLIQEIRAYYNIHRATETACPSYAFRDELNWYINRLWYLQVLYIGTDKRTEISNFIEQLKALRNRVAQTKQLQHDIVTME